MCELLNKIYKGDKRSNSLVPSAYITNANASGIAFDNSSLLDTRASHHLATNVANVPQSQLYNGHKGVTFGNGNSLPIYCVGFGLLSIAQSKGFLALKHILHTPHVTSNLLFVHRL